MTMFSQKAPFDLTDFLSKPATPEARRLATVQRRAVRSGLDRAIVALEAKAGLRPGNLNAGAKE